MTIIMLIRRLFRIQKWKHPSVVCGTALFWLIVMLCLAGCGSDTNNTNHRETNPVEHNNGSTKPSTSTTNTNTVNPAAYLIGFAAPNDLTWVDGADCWVDIKVNTTSGGWSLHSATHGYEETHVDAADLPWDVSLGDVIRWHGPDSVAPTDSTKGEYNADRWDYKAPQGFPLNPKHGMIWLEDNNGEVLDLVVYKTDLNTVDWFREQNVLFLDNQVALGKWGGTAESSAVNLGNGDRNWGRLADDRLAGDSADAWEMAGSASANYYEEALGKTGEQLKGALHRIIRTHTQIPYAQAASALRQIDADPDIAGNVIQFYTGRITTNDFNKEHVWAKSHGGFNSDSYLGYSDLHNLRPTRPDVNSARWHLDFAEGGTLYSDTAARRVDGLSWEPPDAVKGDVARTLFYMSVRYEGGEGVMPDLELQETIPSLLDASGQPNNGQHRSTPRMGKLSDLLRWHIADPPDAREIKRNNIIFNIFQGNRNPFIDHPEWVTEIW